MKLTPNELATVKAYDKMAQEWARAHATSGFWAEEIGIFKNYLPSGKTLEIGSGGGRDAKELIETGYEYVGTDISEGLLKEARKANPGVKFIKRSVYDLDFPNNFFDGFWASAVLLHIPKSRIDKALGKLNSVVREGGIGFISIKRGKGQKVEEDEVHVGQKYRRLFVYYEKDEFEKVLERNGFRVLRSQVKPTIGKTIWLIFFVEVSKK